MTEIRIEVTLPPLAPGRIPAPQLSPAWKSQQAPPVRIEIDPNVRVQGNKTYAGYEDVQAAGQLGRARSSKADGPVSVGQRVLAWESEDDIVTDAVVAGIDDEKQIIYLAVDWGNWRDASEEPRTFYMIACLECGDPERPLPMPFGDQAERGKWASGHTRGTGHDTWRVWEETK